MLVTKAVRHKYLVQTYSSHGKISSHCYLNKYIHTYIKNFVYINMLHITPCVFQILALLTNIYFSIAFTFCYNSFGTFNT